MLVEQMNYAYYSFDVFDTLVTRKTARPNGIFCIIQEKLKKAEQNLKETRRAFREKYMRSSY